MAAQIAHRIEPGQVLPGRTLTTITGEQVPIPTPDALVHLQFRRFASCPICNVHLRRAALRHDEIVAAGVREVAVFHSDAEAMLPHQGDLPFAAIGDPERELYDEFGIEFSARAITNPRAWTTPLNPEAWRVVVREFRAPGSRPLSTRGGSALGLPADFLIATDGMVRAAKYGRHANDQWSVDELLRQVRTLDSTDADGYRS